MSMLDELLVEEKILYLATIDDRDSPHIVPVWFMYKKNSIFIGTNTRTRKVQNVTKNNKVSFCVDRGIRAPDIRGIMGKGDAKLIHEKQKVKELAEKILLRYFSSLENESAQELLSDTDCIIKIIPEQMKYWHY